MAYGDNKIYDSNSAPTPYVTPTQFFDFVDYNLPAMTLCDIPNSQYTLAQMTTEGEEAYNKLNSILGSASGMLELEALAGRLYSAESLHALTGNARHRLNSIVSDIALFMCYSRRDGMDPPQNVIFRYQEAKDLLARLRIGEMIFPFAETQDAGLPITYRPSIQQHIEANRPSVVWDRYFGQRQITRRGY